MATTLAQAPFGLNYQAVIREANGNPVANDTLDMVFTIREGSAGGTVIYHETHAPDSNAFGLVTTVIGKAKPLPEPRRRFGYPVASTASWIYRYSRQDAI
jgi:hypothetical protein